MFEIEHPDITHVNKTGYTRQQWRDLHNIEHEHDDRDRTENDDSEK